MAEALALTRLGKICDIVQGGIGDCLVAPIRRQFTYMCCFNSNITELETQLKDLETTRQDVQMWVDENRRRVRVIGRSVEAWLTSANEITTEVEGIIQDKDKVKEGCLNGWCPNLKLRYSLSRKVVKKTKVVVDLKAVGVQYTHSSYNPPPTFLETITNRVFMGFESRRLIMEEIIEALKHDEINLIGVCGMGGVGKTTLVNEVARRAKEDDHFDDVEIAVVSQEPNLTNVQACIAEMLGLKNLLDTESSIVRADLLSRRLLQNNKKVLVILDDIWAEFDLKAMGIPLEGANKNFKVLYTSRTRDLWHDLQTKKEIPLEILSKDEAWQLFREKAGDSADAPDLQPIAKQIVDECGCLPLALVLIGSALSKKSGRNYNKEIWEGMLDRLTCAGSTPMDKDLSSRLALSYEYLEDAQAKHLFLLCCIFSEDEDIRIEDLARYGLCLSLFDGINEMEKVRRRVFLIVDDLKSRYLLLDSEEEEKECVKVHDVVRDMGISILNKFALVIHGEVSEWPKKDTYENYTCISLISRKITELPRGLTCRNLEFLLLDCEKLKELPCNFFEGMGKLKVLVLNNFEGILSLPSSMRNLHTLSLSFFNGKLDNVSEFGGLFNLNTLSFRNSLMEELPEEIGELVNLRLLDLTGNTLLKRIPPNVISRLVQLEELYVGGEFKDWEGEGKEEEGRNANLRELEFLSNLNTLEIGIRSDVLIPKVQIFSKLKIYKVIIVEDDDSDDDIRDEELEDEMCNLFRKCKRVLEVRSSIPIPSNRGGIDSLLRSSDCLFLEGKGCYDLVQALLLWDGVDGLQQLKLLRIRRCDTLECLANTMNPVHLPIAHASAIFPILKVLDLVVLVNLREICGGPVPARSFGELTFIRVQNCGRLRNLFQLPIVGCLPQLKRLIISSCGMMEEVFWKEQQENVHAAANRIEFPKLEVLKLEKLPSLMRFCRGIDQIDFPQLKELCLKDIPQVNLLFHNNCNLSFNSKRNDNFGSLSLFPEKVILPVLEVLEVDRLGNIVEIWDKQSPWLNEHTVSFKLRDMKVQHCEKLMKLVPSNILPRLDKLQKLCVEGCPKIESVVFKNEKDGAAADDSPMIIPQLQYLRISDMENLKSFYSSSRASNAQSLFNHQVILPVLKVLEVDRLGNIVEIWDKQSPWLNQNTVSSFKLRDMKVQQCKTLLNLVPSNILPRLQHLQNLCVEGCPNIESIFFENEEEEEAADDSALIIPQLRYLRISDMENLKTFYSSSTAPNAQSLFNHQVIFPVLERLIIDGLGNIIKIWEKQSIAGLEEQESFLQLTDLEVRSCSNLMHVFPSNMYPLLRNLKKLKVKYCETVKGIAKFEGEIDEDGLRNEVVSPTREHLEMVEVTKIQDKQPLPEPRKEVESLRKLVHIHIDKCDQLLYVFPSHMLPQNLQQLRIENCDELEVIFSKDPKEEKEAINDDIIVFPRLKDVTLWSLHKLKSFYTETQGFFSHKVAFPVLETLHLWDLDKITRIWDNLPLLEREKEAQSFCQLTEISVVRCNQLEYVLPSYMLPQLKTVQQLIISRCRKIEVIISNNPKGKEATNNNDTIRFPQLKEVYLEDLPNLKSFICSETQLLFSNKVAFPILKSLSLHKLDKITRIWDNQPLSEPEKEAKSFCKLLMINVVGCDQLEYVLPFYMLPQLKNLYYLWIRDCWKMKVIISNNPKEKEATNNDDTIRFPQLKYVDLRDLPNLKSFISSETQLFFSNKDAFPVLEQITLYPLGTSEFLRNETSTKEVSIEECGTSGKKSDHNGQELDEDLKTPAKKVSIEECSTSGKENDHNGEDLETPAKEVSMEECGTSGKENDHNGEQG